MRPNIWGCGRINPGKRGNSMTNLRDSDNQSAARALHSSFWGELLDVDQNYAESYLKWCIAQLKENKRNTKHIALKNAFRNADESAKFNLRKQMGTVKPKGHPLGINPGDIVLVRYGINVGDEISDLQRDNTLKNDHGHYSVVVKQKGFMFLVVPLSSQRQRSNNPAEELSFKGLGIGTTDESHVMFNQIQSVHIRRLKNIQSLLPEGKCSLNPDDFTALKDKLSLFMDLNSEKNDITLENSI
ncbi:hypothetical protein EOC06_33960 [Mesorhizobium sp. M7A.F.Ca.MR.362.00.0.0]|nr:hypothetical protein EOC06_33960 [Mesorhizobium sp. M7A.F.Ca.MR.362.00.0.0]